MIRFSWYLTLACIVLAASVPRQTLVRTDADGYLVVARVAKGTLGARSVFPSLPLVVNSSGYLNVTSDQTIGSLETPATPMANLRGRVDANNTLCVVEATEGSGRTPPTPLFNLKVRTDENGCLIVGLISGGTKTAGPDTALGNAMGVTDENNYLLIVEGP